MASLRTVCRRAVPILFSRVKSAAECSCSSLKVCIYVMKYEVMSLELDSILLRIAMSYDS